MAKNDTLYVIAAAYPDVYDALADFEAVQDLYREVRTSHDFDAAVIAKDDVGNVDIVRKHDEPTRYGSATGLGWGLSTGVAAALFPPVGILGPMTAVPGGAAIGTLAGHARAGLPDDELRQLGEVLDEGGAGLIAVYDTNLADLVEGNVTAMTQLVSTADIDTERLAADLSRIDLAELDDFLVETELIMGPETTAEPKAASGSASMTDRGTESDRESVSSRGPGKDPAAGTNPAAGQGSDRSPG